MFAKFKNSTPTVTTTTRVKKHHFPMKHRKPTLRKDRKNKPRDSSESSSARARHRTPAPPVVRVKVLKPMRLGRVETADDCLRATVQLARRAISGQMNPVMATKLTFILNSVAQQIKNRDDTSELRALRARLEAIGALPATDQNPLPAIELGVGDASDGKSDGYEP
jgi:hypothetical protein